MNDLDMLFMTVEELRPELTVWSSMPRSQVRNLLKLARQVAKLRKDIEIYYLPESIQGFIGPCLCIKYDGDWSRCRVCRRMV